MLSENELHRGPERPERERRAKEIFDFTGDDPGVCVPPEVNETLRALLRTEDPVALHAYTPAAGLPGLRRAVAAALDTPSGGSVLPEGVYVCCGVPAGLAACCRGLLRPGEEALAFAPFLPRLRELTAGEDCVLRTIVPDGEICPDPDALERSLGPGTGLLFLGSPSVLTGAAFPEEALRRVGESLRAAERRFGRTIFLVTDEPACMRFYDDTILCRAFAALAQAGESLGCLAVSARMADGKSVFDRLAGAERACGYVNAPHLLQCLAERCMALEAPVPETRRELLRGTLKALGFVCLTGGAPCGLFVRSPEADARTFAAHAERFGLLLSPGAPYGLEDCVRLNCCVPAETVSRAAEAFAALAADCGG